MPALTLQAAAKLNLYLHVLGKRSDGYHEIESLVVFTSLADELRIEAANTLSLTLNGEFASEAGEGQGNLVLKAANALLQKAGVHKGAKLILTKNIPVGAGLGGGSADAAAALRGLNEFWQLNLSTDDLHVLASKLGADVAMCLGSRPVIARGIGDQLQPLNQHLPQLHAVLVHPRTPLLTKDVYGAFSLQPKAAVWNDQAEFLNALTQTRNHLQPAAIKVDPLVAEILLILETLQPSPIVARMTGSGACCFALYHHEDEAKRAALVVQKQHPHWWVSTVVIGA